MSQATRQSRGLHPIRAAAGVLRTGGWTLNGLDADTVRYAAGVSVWGRWFISVVALFQFAYRFRFWFPNNFEFPEAARAAGKLSGGAAVVQATGS